MLTTIISALAENLTMVLGAGAITLILGLPLGVILYGSTNKQLFANKFLYYTLRLPLAMLSTMPYLIILVFSIPFIKFLADNNHASPAAAILPLSIATVPFFSLLVFEAIKRLPEDLSMTANALGASAWQAIIKIYLPEILPEILPALTTTLIQLLSFSILAGMFGAGGVGAVLMEKGYYAFELKYLVTCALLLVATTWFIKLLGKTTTKILVHHKG